MRRLNLALTVSSFLILSNGCSSSTSSHDGSTTPDGGGATDADMTSDTAAAPDMAIVVDSNPSDKPVATSDGAPSDGSSATDGGLSAEATRGKYMVGLLGCASCHTPKVTGTSMADPTMTLAGVDCFVSTPAPTCLSSANLTNDPSGIGSYSDQAVMDAFRMGKDPSPQAAGKFLFARMPYYQFANLNDDDAKAIVAYLRSLPAVQHQVKAAMAPYDQAPTAAEWTPVDPTKLPAPGAGAPADAANGKYLATIMCVNCHSADVTSTPKHVDEATAFQGGQSSSITAADALMMFQSANLTPDATGIKGWTAMDLVTAIKTAKDNMGKSLCAPMRANAAITTADAMSIADYLLALPPVAHTINACMARM